MSLSRRSIFKKLPCGRFLSLDIHSLISRLRNPPRPALWKMYSRVTALSILVFTKITLRVFYSLHVNNLNSMMECLGRKDAEGLALVTVSNHVSTVDDPSLWSTIPLKYMATRDHRWALAAREYCYNRVSNAYFFLLVKSIPIVRGDGVYQEGVDFVIERLRLGDWVHVFPEGRINSKMVEMRLKWGIGRMIYETPKTPIVLPVHIIGLQDAVPPKWPYTPRLFKKITINYGNPIDLEDLVCRLRSDGATPEFARKAITDVIQEKSTKLKHETEKLHRSVHNL